jgi:hypothetical protein
MTGISVLAAVEGRFDDRLAANGPELLSATDVLLTKWDTATEPPTITAEQRADGRRPGPLVAEGGQVAWGPALITSTVGTSDELVRVAVPELGEAAPRQFRMGFGAASLDGRHVLVHVRRVESRARRGLVPEASGPRARWVIVDVDLMSVAFSQDEDITTASWNGSTVVAGRPSSFAFWSPHKSGALVVDDGTAARSLVPIGGRRWAAGMASGNVISFGEAAAEPKVATHSGPVTALAYEHATGSLATGGEDGRIFVHRGPGRTCELDTGHRVEALTWIGEQALVAKVGGAGGQLLVVRPD